MYQVLALKYRPKTFDELIGQSHIVQTLKNGITSARIANAYLFAGPRGIGKTTTARILAKALNCAKGPTAEPCNSCEMCYSIQRGNALDVIEIDGASNRGIDEIRELRERVKYAPAQTRYKVYIIDEVHMLTHEAFNALLKTLEEPPKHVVFIFATTAPYKIPLTISSRCQRFNFRKISIPELVARVKEIANLESIPIEDGASKLIAQKVDGSLRDAISILDQLSSYAPNGIKEEDVREMLGLPNAEILIGLTNGIIKREPKTILTLIQTTLNQGIAESELITQLIDYLRTLFLFKTGIDVELHELAKKQATTIETHHLLRIIRFLFDTEKEMRTTLSSENYLEQALVRAASCTQVSIDSILNYIKTPQPNPPEVETIHPAPLQRGGVHELPPEPEAHQPLAEQIPEGMEQEELTHITLWEIAIRKLANENPLLASFLAQCKPVKIINGKLFITYKNEFFKTKIEEKIGPIQSLLSAIAKKPIQIIFEEHRKPKTLIEEPIVKKAIEIFNAEPIIK